MDIVKVPSKVICRNFVAIERMLGRKIWNMQE